MSSNVLTYIIEVQDKISDKLKTITIANEQQLGAWADVEKKINSANRSMKNMGGSIGSLREKIAALRTQREWIPASNTAAIRATNHEIKRLEKQITKLESLNGGNLKKWFGQITSSIPALVNPLSMIGVGIAKSVSVGMENELQGQDLMNVMDVARARTAKQYHDFISDQISNELYPNIKWLPSRSASPGEAHRVFWNSNTPGSLWNCKCDCEETDEPVTDKNPNGTMSAKGLDGNPAVTGKVFTDDCPYVEKGGKIVADFWEPIEQHHNDYLKYLKNDEYYNVDFNWNGGMKATHKDHNFDPKKGHYEKEVQNVGFDNGHSVIFTSEVSNIIYKKFTEGLWDDKKFEIAGCETATSNNILRGLKHCASKREKDIAVIYYPNGGFDKDVFDKAIKGYKGLEPQQDDQYLKFDKIICIENNRIVLEIPCP